MAHFRKKLLLLALVIACAAPLHAALYTPDNLPMVHLQDARRYVCNPDAILSADSVAKMDSLLGELERLTGIQTIVAAVDEIEPQDCFDFAHALFTRRGVGQKGKDNGLVVLLSVHERCIQFVTGYGLEGVLPDAICKRIQTRYMNDRFAAGEWDAGLSAGVQALCTHLQQAMRGEESDLSRDDDETDGAELIFLAVIFCLTLLIVGIAALVSVVQKRCPKCHKYKLQRTTRRLLYKRNGVKVYEAVYICSHCGHSLIRREQEGDDSGGFTGGRGGGQFVGGGRLGGGGGGFAGGHFGGGFSGGGGAGSRF